MRRCLLCSVCLLLVSLLSFSASSEERPPVEFTCNLGRLDLYLYPRSVPTITMFCESDLVGALPTPSGANLVMPKSFQALEAVVYSVEKGFEESLRKALSELNVRRISFEAGIPCEALASLLELVSLEEVSFSGCEITEAVAESLRNMPKLKVLELHACKISEQEVLRGLKNCRIESLFLDGNSLTSIDSVLDYADIQRLWIHEQLLPESAFMVLKKFTELKFLSITSECLSDACCQFLGPMSKLESLSLNCQNVTGKVFEEINPECSLQALEIRNMTALQGSIGPFLQNSRLTALTIINTDITDADFLLFNNAYSLKSLTLRDNPMLGDDTIGWITNNTAITSLDISTTKDQDLVWLSGCQNIDVLKCKMRFIDKASGLAISDIRNIRSLALEGPMPDVALQAIITHLLLVREIILADSEIASENSEQSLLKLCKMQNIMHLAINNLSISSDEWLSEMAKLPELEVLKLNNVTCLSTDSLAKMAELPKLRVLDLSNNPQIKENDLEPLRQKKGLTKLIH